MAAGQDELDLSLYVHGVGGVGPVVARRGGAAPNLDQPAAWTDALLPRRLDGAETAGVVMATAALLRHGPGYAVELLGGLRGWMRREGFIDISEARGLLSAARSRDGPAICPPSVRPRLPSADYHSQALGTSRRVFWKDATRQ
jgi:hypothetical protein